MENLEVVPFESFLVCFLSAEALKRCQGSHGRERGALLRQALELSRLLHHPIGEWFELRLPLLLLPAQLEAQDARQPGLPELRGVLLRRLRLDALEKLHDVSRTYHKEPAYDILSYYELFNYSFGGS